LAPEIVPCVLVCLPASDGILSGKVVPTRAYVVLKPCLIFLLRLRNQGSSGGEISRQGCLREDRSGNDQRRFVFGA
jgi:hypothetical protein